MEVLAIGYGGKGWYIASVNNNGKTYIRSTECFDSEEAALRIGLFTWKGVKAIYWDGTEWAVSGKAKSDD